MSDKTHEVVLYIYLFTKNNCVLLNGFYLIVLKQLIQIFFLVEILIVKIYSFYLAL